MNGRNKILTALAMAGGLTTVLGLTLTAQEEPFSGTELKQIKSLPKKEMTAEKACLGFEATFSGPLQEKPKALLDVEKLSLIQGALSKILEVISVSPQRYRFVVTDPAACAQIQENKPTVSVTVVDGKGEDGKKLLPASRSFDTNR